MGNCLKRFKSSDEDENNSKSKSKSKRANQYEVQEEDEQNSQNTSQVPLAVPPQQPQKKEEPKQQEQPQQQQQQQQKPLKSWEVRRQQQNKYPREHYRIRKKENETIIRDPGTLEGNAIAIASCKNCNIYILDNTACVTIDDCINCNVFIGPSESSVFVRDCKESKFVICCGQFRSRDCQNLEIGLFCQSQPVIESSNNMQFFCFQYTYQGFKKQFEAAKLSVWKNNWSDIYDFTPNKNGGGLNYSYLGEDIDPNTFMPLIKPEISKSKQQDSQLLQDSEILESFDGNDDKLILKKDCEVPISTGKREKYDPSILYVFKPEIVEEQNLQKLENVAYKFNNVDSNEIYLKRSQLIQLEIEQSCELDIKDFTNQKMIFIHIGGTSPNLDQQFVQWLQEAQLDESLIHSQFAGDQANEKAKFVFENWNDVRK